MAYFKEGHSSRFDISSKSWINQLSLLICPETATWRTSLEPQGVHQYPWLPVPGGSMACHAHAQRGFGAVLVESQP